MARSSDRRASTPATVALAAAGVDFSVHPYEHVPGTVSYGAEAATALGVDPALVFKTLIVLVDTEHVVAITPVSGQLDLKAVALAMGGKKAALADPARAQRLTGMVVGGISPVGQRTRLRTVLDDSAARCDRIYVSAGRRGIDVALAPSDLQRLTGALLAPIGRRISRS